MKNFTFGDLENCDFKSSEIVILPICYEKDVSYGKGAKNAPIHILTASAQLEAMDEETFFDWSTLKIHTTSPLYPEDNPEKAFLEIKDKALEILKTGKFLLSLGGDHSVTIGPAIAASMVHKNLGILQIDAHLDLRDTWNGSRYNHACVIRRIHESGLPVVQVGIRSVAEEEIDYLQKNSSITTFFAHDIDPQSIDWIDEIVSKLPENVYMTIDLDGLDPSVIPGTGTPEPGGLFYRQLLSIIKRVKEERNIIAADICELVKIEGQQVSEFTAAKIATKIFI